MQKADGLEIEINWELPKLHTIDFKSNKRIAKLKKKLGDTANISLTPFLESEEELIKRNWETFSRVSIALN